jgi:hypothetical protein
MAKTCAVVTLNGGANKRRALRVLSPARRAEHSRQQPDRNDDHGAEQEVAPQPVDGVKTEIPDPLEQELDAVDDIPGVESTRIDNRTSRNTTCSGEPPRKREMPSLAAGNSLLSLGIDVSRAGVARTLYYAGRQMGNPPMGVNGG